MDFFELISKRESCRAYSDKQVCIEDINSILDAARLSPSACNSQPWKFIAVNDADKVKELAPTLQGFGINKFAYEVSTYIIICETNAKLNPVLKVANQHYAQIDIGIAAANITLCATQLGLGSCIIGHFNESKVKGLLNIPKNIPVRLIIALGYPTSEKIRKKTRKPINEIVSFNQW